MPVSNEEFIKRAFEAGLTEDQVRSAVAERNARNTTNSSPSTPQKSAFSKVVGTAGRILNFPSNLLGGVMEASRQQREGTYQAPQTGITIAKNKFGQTLQLGDIIAPEIVGAARGVASGKPVVMEELPKTLGIDPNSVGGKVTGLVGEIATPDLADAFLFSKLGKSLTNKKYVLAEKMAEKVGEGLENAGEGVVLKGLRPSPSQLTKFKDLTGKDLASFLKKKGITGDFEQQAIEFITKGQEEFDDIALRSGRKVDPQDLLSSYQKQIDSLGKGRNKLRSVNQKTAKYLEENLALLRENISEILGPDGMIDVGELTQLRRMVDDEIPVSEFVKAAKGEEVSAAVKERFLLNDIIQKATEDLTTPDGLSLKQLGQELRDFRLFRDIAKKQSNLGRGSNIFGLVKSSLATAGGTIAGIPGLLGGVLLGQASQNPKLIGIGSGALNYVGRSLKNTPISGDLAVSGGRIAKDILLNTAQNLSDPRQEALRRAMELEKEKSRKQSQKTLPGKVFP